VSLRVNLFDAAGDLVDGDDVRPGDAEAARRDAEAGVLATYRADANGGELRCLLAATVDGEERAVLAQGRWDDDGYAGVSEPPWSNFERFVVSQLETAGWRVADGRLTRTVFRKLDNRALDPVAAGQSSLGGRLGDRPAHVHTPSTPDAIAVLNHLARTADGAPISVVVAESVPPQTSVDVVVTSDGSLSAPVVEPLGDEGRDHGAGERTRDGRDHGVGERTRDERDHGATGDGGRAASDPESGRTGADRGAPTDDRAEPDRGAPGGVGRTRRDEPTAPSGNDPQRGAGDAGDDFDLDALSGGDPFAGLDETDGVERGDRAAGDDTAGGTRRRDERGDDRRDERGDDRRDSRREETDGPDPGSPRRADDVPRGAPTRTSDDGRDGGRADTPARGRDDTSGRGRDDNASRTGDANVRTPRTGTQPSAPDTPSRPEPTGRRDTERAQPDAETPERAQPDAETPERAQPDAETPERAQPDAETLERGQPDAGAPERGQPDAETPDRGAVPTASESRRSTGPKLGLAPAADYELRLYESRSGELALSTQQDDPGIDERAVRAADHGVALAVDPQRGRARGTVAAVRNGPEEFIADFDAGSVRPGELAARFVETTQATLDEVGWRPTEGPAGAALVFEHATDAPPFEPDLPGGLAGLLEEGSVDFRVPTHSKAVELFRWVTQAVPRAGVAVADAGRTTETEWADVVIQPAETADGVELVGATAERLDRQALGDRTQATREAFETVVEAVTTTVDADDAHLEAFLARLLAKRLPHHRLTVTAAETAERRRAVAAGWATVAAGVVGVAALAVAAFAGAFDGLLGVAAPVAGVGLLPSVPVGLQLLVGVVVVSLAAVGPAGRFPAVVRWRRLLRAWWHYPPIEESAVFPGSGALLEAPGSGGTLPDRLAALRDSYEASPDAPGRSYGAFLDREVLDTPALAPFSVADQATVRRRRLSVVGGAALVGVVGGLAAAGAVYALAVTASVRPRAVAGAGAWAAAVALVVAGGFALARSQGYDLADLP